MERYLWIVMVSAALWNLSEEMCPQGCLCPSEVFSNCSAIGLTDPPTDIDQVVEILDLSYNRLSILSNMVDLPQLTQLNLSHNMITQVSFASFPQLTRLDLSFNHVSNLRHLHIVQLPNLRTLNLTGNRRLTELRTIESDSVETLDLSHTDIKSFSGSPLSKLSNLKRLILSDTLITSLRNLQSVSLEMLDVSNNEILEISNSAFASMPNLKHLVASHNEKLHIDFSRPTCLSLQAVDFSSCSLPRIRITSLCHVEDIRFDRNSIEIIDDNTFASNTILKTLNVSYNNLETISKWAFLNATQIKTVDVSNNQLQKLDWTKFLTGVRILNLSHNKIRSVDGLNLTNATNLDLSHNEIQIFQIPLKRQLPQIENLNLRGNLIEYITPPMESDTLKNLKLGYCQISIIDKNTFQGLKKLNFLDLEGNKIKRLNYQTLSLIPKLLEVRLGHNPWSCDCKSVQFRTLFHYVVLNKTLVSDPSSLRCDEVKKSWGEACPVTPPGEVSEKHVLFVVGAFFLLALLGMALLVYCKARHIRQRMNNQVLHRTTEADEDTAAVAAVGLPFRRSHSEAEVYARATSQQQSLPPPSYEEALLMPPLTETERMTRSMGVLLDRTA